MTGPLNDESNARAVRLTFMDDQDFKVVNWAQFDARLAPGLHMQDPGACGQRLGMIVSTGRSSCDHTFEKWMGASEALKGLDKGRLIALPLSLAFIDLDNFKHINDSQGHEKGDEVLKAVASTLSPHLRAGDALGRLGGDEFAILLHETDHEQVQPVLTRLARALKESPSLANTGISFSIGVATSNPRRSISTDELLAIADQAMYEIKHSTKDGIGFTVVDAPAPS